MRVVRNLIFPHKQGLPRDLVGCELVIDRERPWIALMTQPLDVDAPATADPLCCYIDTVIFYEHPKRKVAGGNWAEHGRVRTQTQLDDVIETPEGTFVVKAGRVRWSIDHWEMVCTLRRVEEPVWQ